MEDIQKLLKQYYGYDSFRKGQEEVIRRILSGRDVSVVMPTGAGKSLCYQLPALAFPGITLIISPLISLMQDQVRALLTIGVRAAYLNSTLTPGQIRLALRNAAKGMYKLIYVAPERLESEEFLDFARGADISLLVVDESHCISQWGHDFRPSYLRIADFIQTLPRRPVVAAFTATATQRVREDIVRWLRLRKPYSMTTGFDRENLYFGVLIAPQKLEFLLGYLNQHREQSGIIYCTSRRAVETVADCLQKYGYSALSYHGGMQDEDRKRNQEAFLNDRARIMVATNAFGMGIDKPDVRFVIHYHLAQNLEEYYQQAGRAGRDGAPADCILLYCRKDVNVCRDMILKTYEGISDLSEEDKKYREAALNRLQMMAGYASSQTVCLRKKILTYFGESYYGSCHNCSVCNGDSLMRYRAPQNREPQDKNMVEEALLERLKQFRRQEARRQGVPEYVILSDLGLCQLAAEKPRQFTGLLRINGMGESKCRRFGEAFLQIIRQYEAEKTTK